MLTRSFGATDRSSGIFLFSWLVEAASSRSGPQPQRGAWVESDEPPEQRGLGRVRRGRDSAASRRAQGLEIALEELRGERRLPVLERRIDLRQEAVVKG